MTSTLSGLGTVAACPGSAWLPRARREGPEARLGRAIHEAIELQVLLPSLGDFLGSILAPNPNAIAMKHDLTADDAARLAFIAEHLRLPVPAGALVETPLGYFPDGSVRRVEGGAGSYPDVWQILSGTIDCMWSEPWPLAEEGGEDPSVIDGYICGSSDTLWIVDWKTGSEEHVPPVARNWQIRGAVVMAARWTGAPRVIPAICYINAVECAEAVRAGRPYEGRWEGAGPAGECVAWNAAMLDEIEREMRAVLARARGGQDGHEVESWDIRLLRESGSGRTDVRPAGAGRQGARSRGDLGGSGECGRRGAGEGGGSHGVRGGDANMGGPPLILGPHCEWCHARAACPELAREALTLARALENDDEDPDRKKDHAHGHAGPNRKTERANAVQRPAVDRGQSQVPPRANGLAADGPIDDLTPEMGGPADGGMTLAEPVETAGKGPDAAARDVLGLPAHSTSPSPPPVPRVAGGGAPDGMALTTAAASRLAGLIPAIRKVCDAAEAAVQAHVEAHGPLTLADGREYGPVLEEARSYQTRLTYEALAAVVGEERAEEAFAASASSLKRAVEGEGRGAWSRLRKELEARGAVTVSARTTWRKRWPMKTGE